VDAFLGEAQLRLPNRAALSAAQAQHAQHDLGGPLADGHIAEPALDLSSPDDIGAAAVGASQLSGVVLDHQFGSSLGKAGGAIAVTANAKRVVQQTGGHGWFSPEVS